MLVDLKNRDKKFSVLWLKKIVKLIKLLFWKILSCKDMKSTRLFYNFYDSERKE